MPLYRTIGAGAHIGAGKATGLALPTQIGGGKVNLIWKQQVEYFGDRPYVTKKSATHVEKNGDGFYSGRAMCGVFLDDYFSRPIIRLVTVDGKPEDVTCLRCRKTIAREKA